MAGVQRDKRRSRCRGKKIRFKGANGGKEPGEIGGKPIDASVSLALYHQVVINDAAFSAAGSCQDF